MNTGKSKKNHLAKMMPNKYGRKSIWKLILGFRQYSLNTNFRGVRC